MPETTRRHCHCHCHYCSASGETARLTLRNYCAACAKRIDENHLYFRIPKLFTLKGLRTQANGFRHFLRASWTSAAGLTPDARKNGRLSSLKLAAVVWIDQWYVLGAAGWRR